MAPLNPDSYDIMAVDHISQAEDNDCTMPSISIGPYRIQFFEYDLQEKPHVHVWRENLHAKFWLTPVELFENNGYADHELNKIERLLRKERNRLLNRFREEQKKR